MVVREPGVSRPPGDTVGGIEAPPRRCRQRDPGRPVAVIFVRSLEEMREGPDEGVPEPGVDGAPAIRKMCPQLERNTPASVPANRTIPSRNRDRESRLLRARRVGQPAIAARTRLPHCRRRQRPPAPVLSGQHIRSPASLTPVARERTLLVNTALTAVQALWSSRATKHSAAAGTGHRRGPLER